MADEMLKSHYLVLAGSHLYGLDSPTSDRDIRGISIPTKKEFYDLFRDKDHSTEVDRTKKVDTVIYDLRFYLKLLSKGDIGTTEILFAPEANILQSSWMIKPLLNEKQLFLNRKFISKLESCAISHNIQATGESFNAKQAAHSLRCLAEIELIMTSGSLYFPNPRNAEIAAIKFGSVDQRGYEELYTELRERTRLLIKTRRLREDVSENMVNEIFAKVMRL